MPGWQLLFADLTHTAQGISAPTFPLGISFVMSYAKRELGPRYDCRLFKFPADLEATLRRETPAAVCFSNYSWNFELSYALAERIKSHFPATTTIFGGPNFPTVPAEQEEFLLQRPAIDVYVQLEGELGFVALMQELGEFGLDVDRLKASGKPILNSAYIAGGKMVLGPTQRIRDINSIPSPYLSGVLDPFFELPLVPMIETTRGCPFSCTFCADGLSVKSKIARFDAERTREELSYIARRVKYADELIITDLNFAMYPEDLKTAAVIAEIKDRTNWPVVVSASAGKNKPLRTIETAGILKGLWTLGASIQSTDPDVLKAIKRSNISGEAYRQLITYGNGLKNAKTHSEIILGLPGDTKQKHFESLRFGIENKVNSMRMFQAMLLVGTEMATKATREQYGLVTKFRTIPGCVGIYDFLGERLPVSEIEEIIVGSKDLPFDDYLECRVMNLIVETFYNNAVFSEVNALVETLGESVFDCLLYVKEHPELQTPRIREIMRGFVEQTGADLYDTHQQAKDFVLTPEIINRYIGGELGINELLVHRALLFCEFDDICALLFTAVRETLRERLLLTPKVSRYLDELREFILLRKKDAVTNTELEASAAFHYDFQAISELDYRVDPNTFPASPRPIEFRFFHTDQQKRHIEKQSNLYAKTPIGLGRLIQRSNLKLMYRTFEAVQVPARLAA